MSATGFWACLASSSSLFPEAAGFSAAASAPRAGGAAARRAAARRRERRTAFMARTSGGPGAHPNLASGWGSLGVGGEAGARLVLAHHHVGPPLAAALDPNGVLGAGDPGADPGAG